MKNVTDKRVIRTKKSIRGAFAALYSEMPFEDITVTDVARRADINRKTFYNYYAGVHSIVEEAEADLFTRLDDSFARVDILSDPASAVERLGAALLDDADFFGSVFNSRKNTEHTTRFFLSATAKIRERIPDNAGIPPEKLDLLTEFVAAGLIAGYRRWFVSDRRRTPEEVTKDLGTLAAGAVNAFWKNGEIAAECD